MSKGRKQCKTKDCRRLEVKPGKGHCPDHAPRTGRPSKLDTEVMTTFCDYRKVGLSEEGAAAKAGIDPTTAKRWEKRGKQVLADHGVDDTEDLPASVSDEDVLYAEFYRQATHASNLAFANLEESYYGRALEPGAVGERAAWNLLQTLRAQRYGRQANPERVQNENVERIDLSGLSDADLDRLIDRLEHREQE